MRAIQTIVRVVVLLLDVEGRSGNVVHMKFKDITNRRKSIVFASTIKH